MHEVYLFLKKLDIRKKEPIVIGVSYGPDSMFLLYIINKLYKSNKIICAHVHHNHRKESDDEAKLLKEYCNDNDIIFEMMKIDKYTNNKFTEEEARIKRYDFFDKVVNKYNSRYLFTAHHGDDLVETTLMKIVRGSSINGYQAIKQISDRNEFKIIRPLLYLTKDEILNYCEEYKIPYAVDNSNDCLDYTRNRFRHNILDNLKKECPNVHLKFLKFSNELAMYSNYVEDIAKEKYNEVIEENVINLDKIKNEKQLIIVKIIELFFLNNYKEDIKNISKKHVDMIMDMIFSNKPNIKKYLPNKKSVIKSYNKIYFDKEENYNSYLFVLDDYNVLPNNYVIEYISKIEDNSNYMTALDSKELKLPLFIRSKVDGDKIEIKNMKGSKKIKDIYIDEKLSLNQRNNQPIVVDSDGRVLWIPGVKKSKYDKSKRGNYDIILKYYKEEEVYGKK